MGKYKPVYDQAVDNGDYVVVTNASHIALSGRKADQKVYRHHTMYPGGLKEISFKTMLGKRPEEVRLPEGHALTADHPPRCVRHAAKEQAA